MDFYFYLCLRPKKVTIHRGECLFCRQGRGIQSRITKGVLSYWRGPYPDYQTAFDKALIKADGLNVVPVECKHCKRARGSHAPVVISMVQHLPDIQVVNESVSTYEMNRLLSWTELEESQSTEQDELRNLYTNLQRIMQTRHQSERTVADLNAVILKEQHAREERELTQDQALNYQLLEEKQTQEKAFLFNKRGPLVAKS